MTTTTDWRESFRQEFPVMGTVKRKSDCVYRFDEYKNEESEDSEIENFITQEILAAEARGAEREIVICAAVKASDGTVEGDLPSTARRLCDSV